MTTVRDDQNASRPLGLRLDSQGRESMTAQDHMGVVEAIHRVAPELMVVDLGVPVAQVLEMAQAVRNAGHTPIVIIGSWGSAPARSEDCYLGRRREADASGPTPEGQEEMAGRAEAETERMVFDGLEIDVPGRTVVARGETCSLTAREFDLLVVLARRPRRVFTRDELMSLVWGYTDYVDPNAVRVVVCRIREKIEEDPAQPRYIATVRGVGYRFQMSPGTLSAEAT